MITVGNLPAWIPQIARACPFLFPMETRNSIFFITTFDRERALKQLAILNPQSVANRSDALITARLQAKQIVVDRWTILDEKGSSLTESNRSTAIFCLKSSSKFK